MAWWSSWVPLCGLASQGWCTRPLGYLHSLFSKDQLPLSTVYLLFLIIQSVFSFSFWLPLPPVPGTVSSWGLSSTCVCARHSSCCIHRHRMQSVHHTHFPTTGQQATLRSFPCRFVSNSETSCFPLSSWYVCILCFFQWGGLSEKTHPLVATKIRRGETFPACDKPGWTLVEAQRIQQVRISLDPCIWVPQILQTPRAFEQKEHLKQTQLWCSYRGSKPNFCWQRLVCPCLIDLPAGTQMSKPRYLLQSPLWPGGALTCTAFPNTQRLRRRPSWTAGIPSTYCLTKILLISWNKVQRDALFSVEQRGHCVPSFCCTKSFQWNSHLLFACS